MNVNAFILSLALVTIFSIHVTAQVKIGDNPGTIGTSSLLELESTDKALVIPRVANTAAIATPVDGMLIYDNSATCLKMRNNGSWSGCLVEENTAIKVGTVSSLDCVGATLSPGSAQIYSAYTGTATINYSGATGGFYNGESVASTGVTDFTATVAGGAFPYGSGTLIYDITGTPTSTGTASFSISLGGQSCSIDMAVAIDPIAAQLSGASLSNYVAASSGDWVAISQSEYNNLATSLSDVTRFGVAEANALTGTNGPFGGPTRTYGHNVNPSPSNSYVFAFKVALNGDIIEGGNEIVRLSSSSGGTGFNAVGGNLPNGTIDGNQQHFVLKGANTLYANPMYLGFTTDEQTSGIYYEATGVSGRYSYYNSSTVAISGYGWSMQGLSTTTKQW